MNELVQLLLKKWNARPEHWARSGEMDYLNGATVIATAINYEGSDGHYDYTVSKPNSSGVWYLRKSDVEKVLQAKGVKMSRPKLSASHLKKLTLILGIIVKQNALLSAALKKVQGPSKYTEQQKELSKIIEASDFGARRSDIVRLVEAIIGKPLPKPEQNTVSLLPMTCLFNPHEPDSKIRIVLNIDKNGKEYLALHCSGKSDSSMYNLNNWLAGRLEVCSKEQVEDFLYLMGESELDRFFSQTILAAGL